MQFLKRYWLALALILFAGLAVADTTTTNLLLTDQTTGGNPNTWGDIADENFDTIDEKFGDVQAISTTGGDTTLTTSQEIVASINISGTLSSNANIIFSGRGGYWIVRNNTSGDFTVTAKTSGNTGVPITQGTTQLIYCCISSDIAKVSSGNKEPGEVFQYAGATCPDQSLMAYGQAISRETYADLFATISTTYGSGNGSTTFNVPDLRGRVVVAQDDMGGVSADRMTNAGGQSLNGDTLGGTGGGETFTLTSTYMPAHTHGVSITSGAGSSHGHSFSGSGSSGTESTTHTHSIGGSIGSGGSHQHSYTRYDNQIDNIQGNGGNDNIWTGSSSPSTSSDGSHNHSFSGSSGGQSVNHAHSISVSGSIGAEASHTHLVSGTSDSTGTGSAHSIVQPSIVLNQCIHTGV